MIRSRGGEVRLPDLARQAGWSDLISGAGHEPGAVLADVAGLMRSFHGRRRLRPLELASRLDSAPEAPDKQTLYRLLARSLRKHPRRAVLVEPPWLFDSKLPPVLLTATPRSGNTLVQRLFVDSLGYPAVGGHVLDDLAVDDFDEAPLMQVHVTNSRQARQFVARLDARVVTIARHPIDVLLSALHFARNEHQVVYWLDGKVVPDRSLLATASPTSEEFVQWAVGKGAGRLLEVTASWWSVPGVCRVRYEDLVADPIIAFGRVVAELGIERTPDPEVVARVRADALAGLPNHHRWRSKPDGWRDLVTPEIAVEIEQAHCRIFELLGYTASGPAVDPDRAAENWAALRR